MEFPTEPGAHWFSKPSCQSRDLSVSISSALGLQASFTMPGYLCSFQGHQLRSSLHRKHSTLLGSILPAPVPLPWGTSYHSLILDIETSINEYGIWLIVWDMILRLLPLRSNSVDKGVTYNRTQPPVCSPSGLHWRILCRTLGSVVFYASAKLSND